MTEATFDQRRGRRIIGLEQARLLQQIRRHDREQSHPAADRWRITKFQPMFVGDVTAGLLQLLKHSDAAGKIQEFEGPRVYRFKALLELLLTALNRQHILVPIPFALAELQAGLLDLLSNPPLTRDQIRLLKTDKVVSGKEPTLGDLGVQPRSLEEFVVIKDTYG